MMHRDYRVGEVILMQWHGWLKAFRIVRVQRDGEHIEYTMAMLELENQREWKKPG